MDFKTKVELPVKELSITHTDRLLLVGSCFAQSIGNKLLENKFMCDVNPYGILYNPMSALKSLQDIFRGKTYEENDLSEYQNRYFSFMHHSSFIRARKEDTINAINQRLKTATEDILNNSFILITFGSAYVFTLKETGEIVSNCHKLPDRCFERRMLDVEEIVKEYSIFFSELWKKNPVVKILFTVSPIRHIKDGMHGNQLSKSVLLLSIHRLMNIFPGRIFYFPSYELLMDEMRDYRFYAEDMLHPSSVAVNYIWECFCRTYFSKETLDIIKSLDEIQRGLEHKPFNPDSEEYNIFLRQIVLKINRVKEKYPFLDLEKELKLCRIILK